MSDTRILTFYPTPGERFDLLAGLRAWIDSDGKFALGVARLLASFDKETHLEPTVVGYQPFDPTNLDTLRSIVEEHDVMFSLNARWYGPGIQAMSYHHATPPIMFWSFEPFMWGRGDGGPERADSGLLAFARATRSAYVLASEGLGYEITRHRFVQDGAGYRFALPSDARRRGHGLLWVDVCPELGGSEPSGYFGSDRLNRPFGYTRYVLAGTEAEVSE